MSNSQKSQFDERFDQFLSEHDWDSEPSHQSKCMVGWMKKHMLKDAFKQWVAYEEAGAEYFGQCKEGEGWRALGEMRRYDQLYCFSQYLQGYAESMKKYHEEQLALEESDK